MKFNKIMLLAAATTAILFAGCKKQEPFDAQSADDFPRILYPVNESKGDSYTRTLESPDASFTDSCIVSPSSFTTIDWYLDDDLVHTGKNISMKFPAGKYELRIVATTTGGKSTYRTGTITVKPYDGDPYSVASALERNVKPGGELVLNGKNLTSVSKVLFFRHLLDTDPLTEVTTFSKSATKITLTMPALEEGFYFVRLVNDKGLECGANRVTVYSRPVILEGYQFFTLDKACTLQGLNLETLSKMSIDGASFDITATESSATVTVTGIEQGTKSVSFLSADGALVDIITKTGSVASVSAIISDENLLFMGPVEIDWNQDLCQIPWSKLKSITVGSEIKIYYTVPAAEYHQYRILSGTTWQRNVPGGDQKDIKEDTPNPLVLLFDDAFRKEVKQTASMCVVGFGFTVQYITWAAPK